ncbi:unnamed protein product [Gongylonema pulchrum]|uniref:Calponin-homology (CH) domain-containing protein n=1 Tax=Gongylonema pulchrum TaxID=637853 RepID=A0A183DV57_9BILA|nr:unnamed protein product [Gongylonema pulchrum]
MNLHVALIDVQNQARFSIEEAQEVLFWIEQVTNVQFENDPSTFETAQHVADALKDGTQLCALVFTFIHLGWVHESGRCLRHIRM